MVRMQKKHGMPLRKRPSPRDFLRFFSFIEYDKKTGCWNWTGHLDDDGYGQFWFDGRAHWAARFSKQAFCGAFRIGEQANHKRECLNPRCVNPDHLEPLSCSANTIESNHRRGEFNGDDDAPF